MIPRRVWPGLILVVSLAVSLLGLGIWGDCLLSPDPSAGLTGILEARIEADRAAPGPPGDGGAASPWRRSAASAAGPQDGAGVDVAGPDTPAPRPPAREPSASVAAEPRYVVDVGTFAGVEEAARAEARVHDAGFSTVQFRRHARAELLYSVQLPAGGDPRPAVRELRDAGFAEASAVVGANGLMVRVARGMPLAAAVRLAEELRAGGRDPRIIAEPHRDGGITLRHGSYRSREEAVAVARALRQLGIPTEIVRVQ